MTDLTDAMAGFVESWPPATTATHGPFTVGIGPGGRRVASAVCTDADATPTPADIEAAVQLQGQAGQRPCFRVMSGQRELDAALEALGYDISAPTDVLSAATADLAQADIPAVTTFEIWPPLAIQTDLWEEGGVDACRRAVMARAAAPRVALLGRTRDRAAGVGFVAAPQVAGGQHIAWLHALYVRPQFRRDGLAHWLVHAAAHFAARTGAPELRLAVEQNNEAALTLYRAMGFTPRARYHYRQAPLDEAPR